MGRHSRSRSRSRDRRGGGGGGADDDYDAEHDGYRIHIADLGVNSSEKELEKTFRKFGDFRELWLAQNPPCFAFVNFKSRADAETAIKDMDNRVVCGSRVRVSWARPRIRGGRNSRVDSSMRCYQCGERGHFSRECTERSRGGRDDDRRRGSRRSGRRSRSRSRSRSRHRRRSTRSRTRSRSRSPKNRREKPDEAKVNGNGVEQNGIKPEHRSRSRSRDRRRNRDKSYDRRRSRSRSVGRRRRSRSRSNRRRYSRSTSRERARSAEKVETDEALVQDEAPKNHDNEDGVAVDTVVENNENGDGQSGSRSLSRERSEDPDRRSPAFEEEERDGKEDSLDPPATNEENRMVSDELSNQDADPTANADYQSNNEDE